jgi:hypothetical protein
MRHHFDTWRNQTCVTRQSHFDGMPSSHVTRYLLILKGLCGNQSGTALHWHTPCDLGDLDPEVHPGSTHTTSQEPIP